MNCKPTLVFVYNSFRDPLLQNLVLSYIKTLSSKGLYTFHLVTFEQEQYAITASEAVKIRDELRTYGIIWYPQRFHTGRFLILKKLYDLLVSLFTVAQIRVRYHTQLIFAFANVSGAFSIILSKLLSMKFLIFSYEPHAEFQAELGRWERHGLPYKVLSALERYAGLYGDYILTGTQYMVDDLKAIGARGKIIRAPTSVDEEQFVFDSVARERIREELDIRNRPVLLYLGKFGGLYYEKETVLFCKYLKGHIKSLYFLIITPNHNEEVREWFYEAGFTDNDFAVSGPFTNVVPYISAADIGLNAIPPSPSQKYRSPTKIAEYLACGVPYITCQGISEDDVVAQKYKVGAVVTQFDSVSAKRVYPVVEELLNEDKVVQRERCRRVGTIYRSKIHVDNVLSDIFNEVFSDSGSA